MRWVSLVCRLLVGGIFIWASLDKLAHPAEFAKAIHHYRLVPYALLHPAALLLPAVELLAGVALVAGWQRRGAALLCAAMLAVFVVAIASALVRGLDISCGCFDTDGGHAVGLDLLWRDLVLLAACLPPLLARRGGPGLDRDR
ncbi:DoxX family membrane protein [bacterium]|nr:DoxX family membrane protein [bacterium]